MHPRSQLLLPTARRHTSVSTCRRMSTLYRVPQAPLSGSAMFVSEGEDGSSEVLCVGIEEDFYSGNTCKYYSILVKE